MLLDSTLVGSSWDRRDSLNRCGSRSGRTAAYVAALRQMLPMIACGLMAAPLTASPLLDQQNVADLAIDDTASLSQELGQTFTVGLSGPLSRIDVQLSRFEFTSDDAVLTVYSTTGGLPSAVLGSASVSSALISPTMPTFVGFNFDSPGIDAQANDVLAFGITSSTGGVYILPRSASSTYAGGSGVRRTLTTPPGPWEFQTARDYGFRTFVGFGTPVPGNFNSNLFVDAADYVVWRNNLGAPTEAALNGSGNGINGVDQGDYALWRANFGLPGGAGGGDGSLQQVAVPEPASIALLVLGFVLLLRRTWR